MKTIEIKKGWFFGAGSIYGWKKDGLDIFGVGVAINEIRFEEKVRIVVDGVNYILDVKEASDFFKKYKSVKEMRGKRILIVSKSLLKEEK